MCSSPVTLGGGMMMVKGCLARSMRGVKKPPSFQKSYMRSSTAPGS